MKLWMRKVASGSAKIVCESHTLQYDAPRPNLTYLSSSGISATCSGTICRAKTATNSASRPGNGIHANAYAASEARNSGSSTAGMVSNN